MKKFSLLLLLLAAGFYGFGQSSKDTAYMRVITERAAKIVAPLALTDAEKAIRVRDIVAGQYSNLNDVYAIRDKKIAALKSNKALSKEEIEKQRALAETAANEQIVILHDKYIQDLDKLLTPEQVVMIKDGMTYSVVPLTYGAYVDMIPALTEPQKAQIMAWLVEAREHAMDAESSDKKHAWFGKYKGKINNYLSAEGYDAQKERAAWEERIKARKEAQAAN